MADTTLLKGYQEQLSRLIALPSISCNEDRLDQSNSAVTAELASWLADRGFAVDLKRLEGQSRHKENLIAHLGKGEGGLVLSGHTDTVPFDADRWTTDPFAMTRRDDRLYGLGATDMKGFFPVIFAALDRLKLRAEQLKHPLIVLATADEESSMAGARALSRQDLKSPRFALIGEPTSLRPIRLHKGIAMERIHIQGQAGHSSNPGLGNNAIDGLLQVLSSLKHFREELALRFSHPGFAIPEPTLNFGCVHGGDGPTRICAEAALEHDIRLLPGMDADSLREEIAELLKPIADATGLSIGISPLAKPVPAFEEPADSEWVKNIEEISGEEAISVGFTTEAPFLKALECNTLVLGPGSIDQAHQADEFIALEQIEPAVDILCEVITRHCLA